MTKSVVSQEVLDLFNVDDNLDSPYKILELNSKITYLNTCKQSPNYIEHIYNDLGHISISNNLHVGFIIAGVSGETLLEFTSSIANISRLTTSRTLSMEDTLYTIYDDIDKKYINQFISIRNEYLKERKNNILNKRTKNDIEIANKFNLFTKAMSFTISMSLDNWKWYLDSKISNDYEIEFKNVCIEIKNILKKTYSDFIN